jgi:fatty acid synthase
MMRLKAMMSAGIASNEVRPIPSHIFDRDSIEEAFRFMASGKHMGKVLIQMRNEKSDSSSLCISSICKPHFDSNKSFIVTGGLGGFGLELCHWLVESGVTKLIITSRSGIKNGYQKMCLKRMQRSADIVVSSCDMITEVETEKLIKEANEMGPVGGIFHLAMVLNDAVLENQTPGKFAEVCASKVSGTHNLDRVSRRLCPSLDFFVCFSSLTSGRGNAGQTNYGFANSFLEKVCERRRKEGFHGLAIQWGAVGDVGVVAELLGGNSVVIAGSLPQRIPSCLHVLSKFLTSPGAVYSSIVPADKKKYGSDGKEDLLKIVCHVLGVKDSSTLDSDTTLGDLGMDSLMAVEIRQALEREFDMVLSAQEVRCLKIGDIEQLGASRKSKTLEGSSCSRKGSRTVVSLPLSLSPVEEFFTPLNEGEGGKAIFFFGPVTGGFYSLTPFASNIQRPLLGVNWTRELDKFGSLEQVAKHFVKKLNEEYFDNSYDVAGYSFGGLIALLVAQELKEKMRRLVLIDSPGRLVKATHDSSLDIFSSWLLNRKVKEGEIESLDSLVEVLSIERSLKVDTSLLQYAFENYKKKCRLVEGFKMEGSVNCESLLIRSSFEVKMSDDQELKKQIPNLKVKKFDGSSFDLLTLNSEPAGSSMDIFCELLSLA